MSQTALRLREVTKEYAGGIHALRGVSVEIGSRAQVAVVAAPSSTGAAEPACAPAE